MKLYEFDAEEGRNRLFGKFGNAEDVNELSVNYFRGNEITNDRTHSHTNSVEYVMIPRDSGRGILWVEGELYEARPGFSAVIERDESHRWVEIRDGSLTIIASQAPSADDRRLDATPPELIELLERENLLLDVDAGKFSDNVLLDKYLQEGQIPSHSEKFEKLYEAYHSIRAS